MLKRRLKLLGKILLGFIALVVAFLLIERWRVVCVKFSKLDFMVASWVKRGGAKLASLKLVCAAGRASCRYRHHGFG